MDNIDDTGLMNTKISDSAYSTSCSNSQSRRSHSSKSTHSGSNSSGSSGYGGKPSASSNTISSQCKEKRNKDKDVKKKKKKVTETLEVTSQTLSGPETEVIESKIELEEPAPPTAACDPPVVETILQDDVKATTPTNTNVDLEMMEICTVDVNINEMISCSLPKLSNSSYVAITKATPVVFHDGFTCVMSMNDGVVMFTTASLTNSLGYPSDMWIGRSFINFLHPNDRNAFASQITNNLSEPTMSSFVQEKDLTDTQSTTLYCRIRRYKGLSTGFGVKDKDITFVPFQLKMCFKNIIDEDGKTMYLVIQATPISSAFRLPNEAVDDPIPFTIRHSAKGKLEFVDFGAVSYLGYLPQDLLNKDMVNLFHPDDLLYVQHVHEHIVKEGSFARSKPYRMLTHNAHYLRLETEWTSFINPWSRKLEFVIGKHYIIEGPANPDVFQKPAAETMAMTEQMRAQVEVSKQAILRIMNDVPTKPADIAKMQMTKRCQEIASFMGNLIDEQLKVEVLRVEIQEPDHSYYERDSVMLGGISPHHDYNDSKSSTETPLSYTQLNYNDNLQRYFDCHEICNNFENHSKSGEEAKPDINLHSISDVFTTAQNLYQSGDAMTMSPSMSKLTMSDQSHEVNSTSSLYQSVRLTETLLKKHNDEMEHDLMRQHREHRCSKGDREKISFEKRNKKKEHLARCNAPYQPTTAGESISHVHSLKRASRTELEDCVVQKHPRMTPRQRRRANLPDPNTVGTTVASSTWLSPPVDSLNNYMPAGIGSPGQMPLLNPMSGPELFPIYYVPVATMPSNNNSVPNTTTLHQGSPLPYVMYGQPISSSLMLSPKSMQYQGQTPHINPEPTNANIGLSTRNYEEATRPQAVNYAQQINCIVADLSDHRSSSNSPKSSVKFTKKHLSRKSKSSTRAGNSENVKTDGESSYSSFYSSFFKTDSAEESGDNKFSSDHASSKIARKKILKNNLDQHSKDWPPRKMEPPWMNKVCVTSDLVYNYQVTNKSMEEVLSADKQKISEFDQPQLVNEQLNQLYMDMQLEGVASRLTLEEGITSSGSSGEESCSKTVPKLRSKSEYSKMVMIYEEDAPLPPPTTVHASPTCPPATCSLARTSKAPQATYPAVTSQQATSLPPTSSMVLRPSYSPSSSSMAPPATSPPARLAMTSPATSAPARLSMAPPATLPARSAKAPPATPTPAKSSIAPPPSTLPVTLFMAPQAAYQSSISCMTVPHTSLQNTLFMAPQAAYQPAMSSMTASPSSLPVSLFMATQATFQPGMSPLTAPPSTLPVTLFMGRQADYQPAMSCTTAPPTSLPDTLFVAPQATYQQSMSSMTTTPTSLPDKLYMARHPIYQPAMSSMTAPPPSLADKLFMARQANYQAAMSCKTAPPTSLPDTLFVVRQANYQPDMSSMTAPPTSLPDTLFIAPQATYRPAMPSMTAPSTSLPDKLFTARQANYQPAMSSMKAPPTSLPDTLFIAPQATNPPAKSSLTAPPASLPNTSPVSPPATSSTAPPLQPNS